MSDHLLRAEAMVREMFHLAASQCRGCGLAFDNIYGTHEPRGLLRRPSCRYEPVGAAAVQARLAAKEI